MMIFIPVNRKEKPNSRKKNCVSFIEIPDTPLPVCFVPATVGIFVMDMTKKLNEKMNIGSNTTGFSKLTYRGMRQI